MKDIPGYEGLYSIDESGNVFSYRTKKFLKQTISNGYLTVHLTGTDKKHKQCAIHRLIALTYIPNPDNLPVIDHIDRNKLNNSIENLKWTTVKENNLNRDWEQCRKKMREVWTNMSEEARKERVKKANQASAQANVQVLSKPVEMRDKNNHDILIKTYPSCCQAARQEFGDVMKQGSISKCARGERKSAYGYFWKYVNPDASCEEET